MRVVAPGNDGVTFNTNGEEQEIDEQCHTTQEKKFTGDKSKIQCWKCKEMGHFAWECPKKGEKKDSGGSDAENGQQHLHMGENSGIQPTLVENELEDFSFHNNGEIMPVLSQNGGKVPDTWILLDNQSTVDVFSNPKLLRNIRKCENGGLNIHCNAGTAKTVLIGDLPGYGTVWYHEKGIANILLLSKAKEKYKVTFDSSDDNSFIVHKPDGEIRVFKESEKGLYYMDAADKVESDENAQKSENGNILINTVADNKSKYSHDDYLRAQLARSIQQTIGRPVEYT